MDIIYSKELNSHKKNEFLPELQFKAIMLVDNGANEDSDFGDDELHRLIVQEVKRRLLVSIKYKVEKRSIKYAGTTLHKYGIRGRKLESILEEASKQSPDTLRKLVNEL